MPYCIWYPDLATEETYRRLVIRYPHMRHHVGRACAVARYFGLYKELDLLPDLSIAEEARDNRHNIGSRQILEGILAQPCRWIVMNDYNRCVDILNALFAVHGLNADTAVRSCLVQSELSEEACLGASFHGESHSDGLDSTSDYFDITEDGNIKSYIEGMQDEAQATPTNAEMTRLFWQPLTFDLPEGNKDLLILMAAYHGNIDRYHRLRRPKMLPAEPNCIIRGIYHNTRSHRRRIAIRCDQSGYPGINPSVCRSHLVVTRCMLSSFVCLIMPWLFLVLLSSKSLQSLALTYTSFTTSVT